MPARAAEALLEPWWARLPADGEPGSPGRHTLVAVLSAEFPPGTVVDLPDVRRPRGWQVAVRADGDGGRVHRVEVAGPGPLLWYVAVDEPDAAPAAVTLVAFSDARHPDGAVLTQAEAQQRGVAAEQQVGALRWWTGTGTVHQVYVAPRHRRRGVAGKLVHAGYGIQAARGLPGLHGDGRRTDDGESWRAGLPEHVARRMAPRTRRLPAMTPGEQPVDG